MPEIQKVKEQTIRIPMHELHVDHSWNGRSLAYMSEPSELPKEGSEGPDGETGLAGLIASIKAKGQQHAVDVRLYPGKGKFTYSLVTGFRRHEALRRIAEQGVSCPNFDPRNPTILVNIRNLTEVEARDLNGIENLERKNLTVADTAFHIMRLHSEAKKAGNEITDSQIAERIGRSQGYVSKLRRTVEALNADITKAWRESPVDPLVVGDSDKTPNSWMQLATFPKSEQNAKFQEFCEARSGGKAGDAKDKTAKWLADACTDAAKTGLLLGMFELHGAAEVSMGAKNVEKLVACLFEAGVIKVRKGKDVTEHQFGKLADALKEGHAKGLNPPPPPEEKPKKEKNGKGEEASASA